jgi:hypothetical protein
MLGQNRERIVPRRGRVHLVRRIEGAAQQIEDDLVIVDDEQALACDWKCHRG